MELDVVIFGGGCAGLWLLDDLRRQGVRVVLLEAAGIGGTQTTGSQGILHGGVKYVLSGLRSDSASAVKDMPARWRASLSGKSEPDLSPTRIRSRCCYLWRSDSWQSWAGMLGARAMLEVKPVPLKPNELPDLLSQCPGQVFRLDEEVIDTVSFAQVMAVRNRGLILKIDPDQVQLEQDSHGAVRQIVLTDPDQSRSLQLCPRHVVLAAGSGNEGLRQKMGLPTSAAQRRPLHMVLARGNLPSLNGHCVDGAKTRVTITSDQDSAGRTVWQVGGQLAEDGVQLEPAALIKRAQQELTSVLPGFQAKTVEWTTYRIDRAERRTTDGTRPDDVQIIHEQNILTVWPTKLVLAPRMAQRVQELLGPLAPSSSEFRQALLERHWPSPTVASPPWEQQLIWTSDA